MSVGCSVLYATPRGLIHDQCFRLLHPKFPQIPIWSTVCPLAKNDLGRSIFSLQSHCKFHCQPAPHLTSANFSKLCFCIWLAPPASHKTINILIYLLVENSQNPHRIHFTEKYWNSFQSFSVSVFHKAASTGAAWRSGLKKNKTEKFLWSKNRRRVR